MVKTFKVYLGTALDPFILPGTFSNASGCGDGAASSSARSRTNSSRSSSSVGEPMDYLSTSPQSTSTTAPLLLSSSPGGLSSCGSQSFYRSTSTSGKSPTGSSSCSSSPPASFEMIKYSCVHCQANLARHEDLISKSFQGSQGRAYLFQNVVNVKCSRTEERVLLTGLHCVCDISCQCCHTVIGWKYERAYEASQKYKEGKFIVELAHLMKDNCWEVAMGNEERLQSPTSPRNSGHFFN